MSTENSRTVKCSAVVSINPGMCGASAPSDSHTSTAVTTFVFTPHKVTILKNHRVKWVNDSGSLHHILFTNGAAFDKDVPVGGSVIKVFRYKGTFHYHCTIHSFMTGVVKVT